MADGRLLPRWAGFWNRSRWWKALVLVVGYFVLYQAASLTLLPLGPRLGAPGTATNVLLTYALPIVFGGVILVAFGASVGWLKDLFARQPVRSQGWMWIGVAVVLISNVIHFASVDYAAAGASFVLAWLVAGLAIGFAEEVLTRGYVVRIMRRAGHGEVAVALVSAALFAVLHLGNLLTGQAVFATLLQIPYTFAIGICMYLALRVTGRLLAPILLHASTDPSIFIQITHPAQNVLSSLGRLGNPAVIVVGLLLVVPLVLTRRRELEPLGAPSSAE